MVAVRYEYMDRIPAPYAFRPLLAGRMSALAAPTLPGLAPSSIILLPLLHPG